MSAYTEELLKTREIIRRFDEIMLNKANKFEIERYRAELKNYVTIENLKEYKKQVSDDKHELQEEIDEFDTKLKDNFSFLITSIRESKF